MKFFLAQFNARIVFVFLFSVIVLSPQPYNFSFAQEASQGVVTHTAKVLFFAANEDNIVVTIIPYAPDGSYPKSGWITCEAVSKDIKEAYSQKLKVRNSIEGYFTATYKITGKVEPSAILHYKGELLKLEPWDAPFLKKQ